MSANMYCMPCNVACGTKRAYQKHLSSNGHRNTVELPPLAHPCPGCRKLYSRESEVERHLKNGKCSSEVPFRDGVRTGPKHGLSVSPDKKAWKHRRIDSFDQFMEKESSQKVGSDCDSAISGFNNHDTHRRDSADAVADPMNEASLRPTDQPSLSIALSVEKSSAAIVNEQGIAITDVSDTLLPYKRVDAPVARDEPMAPDQQAVPNEAVTTISKANNALDLIALAKSLQTLSFEEFKQLKLRSDRTLRKARDIPYRSSSTLSSVGAFDPAFSNPDSLRLFGLRRASPLTPPSSRPCSPSSPGTRHCSRLSGDQQYLNDNGRKLVQRAAEGNHDKVYNILMHKRVNLEYLSGSSRIHYSAVTAAITHGHVEVLNTILKTLRSNSSVNDTSHVEFFMCLDHARLWSDNSWDLHRSFIRCFVAGRCCRCPRKLHSGSVCEAVALEKTITDAQVINACYWSHKLRQPSWPEVRAARTEPWDLDRVSRLWKSIGLVVVH